MSLGGWIIAYLSRWLPHPAPIGLVAVGSPDHDSPVIVTANFSLTVRRVRRALAGQNLWLLVVNSGGINVWCGAVGGRFNESRVIDAIKVSRLSERVRHREVILPALSAPGVDRQAILQATGFQAHFGPVYARDIADYLRAGRKKTERMCRFRCDLRHRLDMFIPMNFPVYAPIAVVLALVWPGYLLGFTVLFWLATGLLYLLVDYLPGRSGWSQSFLAAGLFVLVWGGTDWTVCGDPRRHWGWLLATVAIFLAAGLDLAGIATLRKSDPEQLLGRLGLKRLGNVYTERMLGQVRLDCERCRGCGCCYEVCPVGVFGPVGDDGTTTVRARQACFACGACVKQCPESALSIT